MDIDKPLPLLGGLSPAAFMRRHWQKQPLLVRQAWPGVVPPLSREQAFALAGQTDMESRLVRRLGPKEWQLAHGPITRRQIPSPRTPNWTLLLQGLDLQVPAAEAMREAFAFVPRARLDDLMLSYASDGGGVGPHLDSYDVFLLQVHGRRRWRIAPPSEKARLIPGLPLKILRQFKPTQEWLLEPGDMLYLPPLWAHDGVAQGECMTASIGFRAPAHHELAHELLVRMADEWLETETPDPGTPPALYADPRQPAVPDSARIPPALQRHAQQLLAQALARPGIRERALGSWLTEPKPQVVFEPAEATARRAAPRRWALDARTKMLYDQDHLYINGEAYSLGGADAGVLHRLADDRQIDQRTYMRLSVQARSALHAWQAAGWIRAVR